MKRKILCVIDTFRLGGGAQTQLAGLCVMLKLAGYDVIALSYYVETPEKSLESYLFNNGVQIKCLADANSMFDKFLGVYKTIKAVKPDVVISYLEGPSIICTLIKALYPQFHLIVSERNVTQYQTIRDKVRFNLYRYANYIVPNSYSQEEFIKLHYPKLASKIETITNYVDTERFIYRLDVTDNSCLDILIVARVGEQKNVLKFIDVARVLKDRRINFKIHWYGYSYPEYLEKCKEKINILGLGEFFYFHDPMKNIETVYTNPMYDVFCLPSLYEGCPNTIGEAMSCGLPILCSDVCDNSRIVSEGNNGFLFNPNSIDDMVQKIIEFAQLSVDKRVHMGEVSRKLAEEKLSRDVFLSRYISIINNRY